MRPAALPQGPNNANMQKMDCSVLAPAASQPVDERGQRNCVRGRRRAARRKICILICSSSEFNICGLAGAATRERETKVRRSLLCSRRHRALVGADARNRVHQIRQLTCAQAANTSCRYDAGGLQMQLHRSPCHTRNFTYSTKSF